MRHLSLRAIDTGIAIIGGIALLMMLDAMDRADQHGAYATPAAKLPAHIVTPLHLCPPPRPDHTATLVVLVHAPEHGQHRAMACARMHRPERG